MKDNLEEMPLILVVEDDAQTNALACKKLRGEGFDVRGVYTGTAAIDHIAQHENTLLLIDYMLPDLTASEAIEAMGKSGVVPPFIVMTGHGDQKIAVEMMKLGARDYLTKDITFFDELLRVVRRVAAQVQTETILARVQEEKVALEDQLRQAQKMEAMGRLAAGVAHDFNNLITAIQGYSQMALMDAKGDLELNKRLTYVVQAAEKAASLTRQLALFSRKQPAYKKNVQVERVVDDMVKILQHLIGEDVEIVTQLDDELPPVYADPGCVEQVVMNLAINARDAMPEGGRLTINASAVDVTEEECAHFPDAQPGQYVCLSVTDNGTGMDSATLERVFEPFYTTKGEDKGTGLGMAIVYGIVRQHCGWLTVESEPGKGAEFSVHFPACVTESVEMFDEVLQLGALQGHGERILVVEDDEGMRDWCSLALRANGYTSFLATNVREAVELFEHEQGNFDLVISDVIMPGASGVELRDFLLRVRPDLRVILSSGYTADRVNPETFQNPRTWFLEKPYTTLQLLGVVNEVLGEQN